VRSMQVFEFEKLQKGVEGATLQNYTLQCDCEH